MIVFVAISFVVLLTVIICNVLLWKYPLERRPGAAKLVACVVLCISVIALTVGILTVSEFVPDEEGTPTDQSPCIDLDYDDFDSQYGVHASNMTKNATGQNHCPFSVVPRSEWVTSPSMAKGRLKHPVEIVAVSNTCTASCTVHAECTLAIRILLDFHTQGIKWLDVGYNFFVGGDGKAYEGRGWDIEGAHDAGLNETVLGISFLGTFTSQAPPPIQIKACRSLIREGVRLGKISPNYIVVAHQNTGKKLLDELQTWTHWYEVV